MADTQRTLTALQALFANNTAGAVDPQDIRDFVLSVFGGYGGIYCTGGVAALVAGTSAVQVTGFNGAFPASGITASHAGDSLTTLVAGKYKIHLSLSFSAASTSLFTFSVYNDAVLVAGTSTQRRLAGATDIAPVSISAIVDCAQGDVLTVYVLASDENQSITVTEAQFIAHRVA